MRAKSKLKSIGARVKGVGNLGLALSGARRASHLVELRFACCGLEAHDLSGTSDPYLVILQVV